MSDTSASLLERARDAADADAWRRLVDLYTPLIRGWLHRQGVRHPNLEDLTQEVLAVLVRELPNFEYSRRPGAFRHWLRTVTVNRLRAFWRAEQTRTAAVGANLDHVLAELEDPHSAPSRLWDEEHDRHVLHRLLELIEPEFTPPTWEAFRRLVLQGQSAAAVAEALSLSVNAVLIAKSRVLRRLREEQRGLID